jgi:hypothetical protein
VQILGLKLSARLIAALVGVLLVVAVLLWGPAACRSYFTQKKQAEVARGQAGAAIASGAEAVNTLGNVMESSRETDAAVNEGSNEIHNATEADRGLAAERAACRLRAYRDLERCARLLGTDPAANARARARH